MQRAEFGLLHLPTTELVISISPLQMNAQVNRKGSCSYLRSSRNLDRRPSNYLLTGRDTNLGRGPSRLSPKVSRVRHLISRRAGAKPSEQSGANSPD